MMMVSCYPCQNDIMPSRRGAVLEKWKVGYNIVIRRTTAPIREHMRDGPAQ